MKEQQNLWDFGLELAFSVMLFLICPDYDNLRSKLMLLGNVNIMSDAQKTDDLVSLCSLLDLYFCSKGFCFCCCY